MKNNRFVRSGGLEVELSQCKREGLRKTAKIESELAQRNKEVPEISGIVDGAEKAIADNTDVGVSREKEEWEKEKLGLLHDLDGKEKSIKEMQESLKEHVRHLNEMKGENAMLREESEKYRRLAENVKQDLNEQLKEKQAKVTALMLELEDQAIELAISKKSNQQLEKRMQVMEMKLNAFMTALPTPDRSGPGGTSDKKTGPLDQVHEHVQKPKQSTTRWDVGPPGDKNDKKRRR